MSPQCGISSPAQNLKIEYAPVMELVDMRDLGSRAFSVWVRVPSGAPNEDLFGGAVLTHK